MPVPLLIISDNPSCQSGLGRICGDIAVRVNSNLSDIYRMATFGYGSPGSCKFNFPQYNMEGMHDWFLPTLPQVWEDFAGQEKGIILTIWDATRLGWFARPEMSDVLADKPEYKKFLTNPPFKKFGYITLDASGPNDRLTYPLAQTLLGFDRILAYGKWAEDVIRRTLGDEESEKRGLTSLPHGINTDIFYERDRRTTRAFFFAITHASTLQGKATLIQSDEALIGILATNQSRKDWALGIEAVAILSRQRKIRLWLHVDVLERNWSIPALLVDHGLLDKTVVSLGYLSDDALAKAYSACDVVFGIGAEGFGFCNVESQACGTPCITGSFAGGAELVPAEARITPVGYRYESIWACKRPVYNPQDWADKANEWIGKRVTMDPKYDWKNNWAGWEAWFREGVNTPRLNPGACS